MFWVGGYIRHEGCSAKAASNINEDASRQWWNNRILGTEKRLPAFFQGVKDRTAIIVCDRSYKDDWGTAAVIMAPKLDSFSPVIAVHVTPGMKQKHNPYRAELAGIVAGVISVETECADYDVTHGKIIVGCDCDSALQAFRSCLLYRPASNTPDFDLKSQLYELLRTRRFDWDIKDITGHQDDHRPYHQLTVWEQWNVDADYFAKAHWKEQSEGSFYHLPPVNELSIWHKGHRMTTWSDKDVYRRIFSDASEAYWFKKLNITQPSTIAFDLMGKSFKGMQIFKRLWLSKALTERLPTTLKVAKWTKDVTPDKCHRCGESEDAIHALGVKHQVHAHIDKHVSRKWKNTSRNITRHRRLEAILSTSSKMI